MWQLHQTSETGYETRNREGRKKSPPEMSSMTALYSKRNGLDGLTMREVYKLSVNLYKPLQLTIGSGGGL